MVSSASSWLAISIDSISQRDASPQRMLDRLARIDQITRLERSTTIDQFAVGQRLEHLAEFIRRVHDQRLQRDDRC